MVRVISKRRLYLFVAVKGYQMWLSQQIGPWEESESFPVCSMQFLNLGESSWVVQAWLRVWDWEDARTYQKGGMHSGSQKTTCYVGGLKSFLSCSASTVFVVQCLRLKHRDELILTSTEQRLSGLRQWQHLWCHHLIQKKIQI